MRFMYKIVKSPSCTSETNVTFHVNYTQIKKEIKIKLQVINKRFKANGRYNNYNIYTLNDRPSKYMKE